MTKKIKILVCEKFKDESLALQGAEGSYEYEVICFQARCGCPEVNWDELEELIAPGSAATEIHILGSCCIAQLAQGPSPISNCTLHHRKQCFYLFSASSHIDSLLENGSYLATPGWLKQWRLHLEKLGFNHADEARDFFRQSAKNITLLDTLIFPDSISQARDFSDFVGLPLERIPLGLDFYQLFVHEIIAKNKIQAILSESKTFRQRASDSMMSMDILAGLSVLHDEQKIIDAVLELFTMLFSPQEIRFFPTKEKEDSASPDTDWPIPWEKIDKDKFALIAPDNRGFWLLLQADTFYVGSIKVDEVAFPEYIREYINLALPVARLCGLVISNARTEKELRSAQKMEAIGTMAGGIVHNFNNSLGAVLGFIDMALEEIPESNREHHYLERALSAANRVKDLVSQIMIFSQQKMSVTGICSPVALVPGLIAAIRNQVPAAIRIEQNVPSDIGIVALDARSFEMIFHKLCSNSIDAMGESGGVLGVTLGKIEIREDDVLEKYALSPGHFVEMTITDTGQGIPSENLMRIFDPFFTTKEVGKGDGIGLSVVKGILRNNGGRIDVQSEQGKGATFTITLPIAGA